LLAKIDDPLGSFLNWSLVYQNREQ